MTTLVPLNSRVSPHRRWGRKRTSSADQDDTRSLEGGSAPKLSPVARMRVNFGRSRDDSDVALRADPSATGHKNPFRRIGEKLNPLSGHSRRTTRQRANTDGNASDESRAHSRASSFESYDIFDRKKNNDPSMLTIPSHRGDSTDLPQAETRPAIIRRGRSEDKNLRRNVTFDQLADVKKPPIGHRTEADIETAGAAPSRQVSDSHVDYLSNQDEDIGPDDMLRYALVAGYGQDARNLSERAHYSVHVGNSPLKRKLRVRPYHCYAEPMYLTEEEIYADSLKPSENYSFLDSYLAPSSKDVQKVNVDQSVADKFGSPYKDGRIGAIRVEVLGCVSLHRSKPDVAAYLVCGDAAFSTDIVQGYRSPMWPSVSKRAAVFPIHHAYARLYVGIFDVKQRKNKENDAFCGRVSIDIASLRPRTEYDITFPLRASTFVYDRRKRGVVRLRFSLHWFSERAAVLSYFKGPKALLASNPLVYGSPTIPCADPKTFRNVAVTVHGQDLPGKYSRNAFRATMREFNLYQQNLREILKYSVKDAILYEYPFISLYLFISFMYCISTETIRLVPPILLGYCLILYYKNYQHFVARDDYNFGYRPLTMIEVLQALITNGTEAYFEPIIVGKRAKKRANKRGYSGIVQNIKEEDEDIANQPQDHLEFPFSEKLTYPKLSVEEALAPSNKKSNGDQSRLHGRLSVYYTPANDNKIELETGSDEDESSDVSDDETVITESGFGDNIYDDLESGDIEEDEVIDDTTTSTMISASSQLSMNQSRKKFLTGSAVKKRRLRVGPPQNSDVAGRKIPPQVHLKRVENILHKISLSISVEHVDSPQEQLTEVKSALATTNDAVQAAEKRMRKLVQDEFDKLLGMQSKGSNPIHRIMGTFLGPLMRMIRIIVFIIRIAFNISTWRDPYLSFWVSVGLCVLFFILIIFPWKAFFTLATLIGLGPQNILLRNYLEKKAVEKQKKDSETELHVENINALGLSVSQDADSAQHSVSGISTMDGSTKINEKIDGKKWFFNRRKENRTPHRLERLPSSAQSNSDIDIQYERRPFSSEFWGQITSGKKLHPRSVAIPYSRFRKERFYDWPPDPTVSKAQPIAREGRRRALLTSSNSFDSDSEEISTSDQQIPRIPSLNNLRRRVRRLDYD